MSRHSGEDLRQSPVVLGVATPDRVPYLRPEPSIPAGPDRETQQTQVHCGLRDIKEPRQRVLPPWLPGWCPAGVLPVLQCGLSLCSRSQAALGQPFLLLVRTKASQIALLRAPVRLMPKEQNLSGSPLSCVVPGIFTL